MVQHTDAEREYQYSAGPKVQDAATKYGWQLIDMKNDWRQIFPDPVTTTKAPPVNGNTAAAASINAAASN